MIVLPSERRRAADFARLLDEQDAGAPVEAVGFDAELSAITALAVAGSLADMSPEASARIRRRLLAVAAVRIPEQPGHAVPLARRPAAGVGMAEWLGNRRIQLRLSLAAGVALLVLIATAVGVAGNRSLPGDPLYGVKRVTEGVQLTLTRGDLARGKLHFAFANTRLTEVTALLDRDNGVAVAPIATRPLAGAVSLSPATASHVVQALADMDVQTTAGTKDLTHAWQQTGAPRPLALLSEYSRTQFTLLRNTLPDLPIHAHQQAQASLSLLVDVSRRADQLSLLKNSCDASCRGGNSTTTSGVAIRGDALGALPCVGSTCPPKNDPTSGVAVGVGTVDSTTTALIQQLQASINSFPESVPPDPAPAPAPAPAGAPAPAPLTPTPGAIPDAPTPALPAATPTVEPPTPDPATVGPPTPGTPTPGTPTPGTPTPGTPTPGTPTPGSPTPGSPTADTPTPEPSTSTPGESETATPGLPTPESAGPESPSLAPPTSSPSPTSSVLGSPNAGPGSAAPTGGTVPERDPLPSALP